MRATLILCDLDDLPEPRPGVAVVQINVDGMAHPVDVCQEHLELLQSLPLADSTQNKSPARSAPARASTGTGRGRAGRPGSVKPGKKSATKPATKTAPKSGTKSATKVRAGSSRQPGSRRDRQARIAAARDWARAQGRDVAERGRLPQGLLAEYEKAHS